MGPLAKRREARRLPWMEPVVSSMASERWTSSMRASLMGKWWGGYIKVRQARRL